jgi:hypothetical protein
MSFKKNSYLQYFIVVSVLCYITPKLLSANLSILIQMIADDGDRKLSKEGIKCLHYYMTHFNWLNFTGYVSDDTKRHIYACGHR